ncbi:MAG TPA: efflux RND transporter periplasmic adaptor subunit [Blastocatellia bacterium]|nr:efflux RND transporter periplasmic adaptor subunit [Blastocatellia bacterium]
MKTGSFRKTILFGAVFLVLLGTLAAWKYFSGRESADNLVLSGTIEADEIHVGSKVGGRIASVVVNEGQAVKQGQPLIHFDRFDLDAKRADAAAAVAEAEANLQKTLKWSRPEEVAAARAQAEAAWMSYLQARNGPRKEEIDAARAELSAAEADHDVAKVTLERTAKLVSNGVQSQQEYDNAKSANDRAAARREAARQKLDLLLAGTREEEIARAERLFKQAAANRELVERGARKEDIEMAKAQVERARATLKQIDIQLGELEVTAPADAVVEVLQVRPGELINPNAPVATLVEVDRLWVRVYVPEPEKGNVQLGKEVSVEVDTFRGERFRGRIEEISSRGEFTPRNIQTRDERAHQVFGLRVRLDNSGGRLSAGMAADVTIPK